MVILRRGSGGRSVRMDSMRGVLARTPGNRTRATACATPRSPLRQGSHHGVDFRGASAGFSHRERLLLSQRALSVSGVALTGLGSRSRRHVSRARDERRLLGTPRVTACTGPVVEGRPLVELLMLPIVERVSPE